MAYPTLTVVTVYVDSASGTGSADTDPLSGRVIGVRYIADGSAPYSNTADFTITTVTTGQTILTLTDVSASTIKYPYTIQHESAGGADAIYATGNEVRVPIYVFNEKVRFAVAQAGTATTGQFQLLLERSY